MIESMTSLQSTRIDWKSVVERVKFELPWFLDRGIVPTLRTLLYRLVYLEVIPNTNQAYKQLSSVTIKASACRYLFLLFKRSGCENNSKSGIFGLVISIPKLYETTRDQEVWKRNPYTLFRRLRSFWR